MVDCLNVSVFLFINLKGYNRKEAYIASQGETINSSYINWCNMKHLSVNNA